jgi:hypothetical protein
MGFSIFRKLKYISLTEKLPAEIVFLSKFTRKAMEPEPAWENLLEKLEKIFLKKPTDVNSVLFLIGVNELGQGYSNFSKEQKQDLIHVGICKVLSLQGMYEFEGRDEQGWPHWKNISKVQHQPIGEQEAFLKSSILLYFHENNAF